MENEKYISLEEYEELLEDNVGFCIKCGEFASCVEPDARKYLCQNCGEKAVYGLEECLMMGIVQ